MIYFDSAATTFEKPPQVAQAVLRAMQTCSSPSRGGYRQAMQADEVLFACRQTAAQLFDAEPEQVVFTVNATHGLNIAIRSVVQPGQRVIVSGFEHNAVMRPLALLGAQVQTAGKRLFAPEECLNAMKREIRKGAAAVVCTHVSNVFGYRIPVEQIGQLCRRAGIPFVLDASQSAGCLPVSLADTGAAFIAMPGHKGLYGPQGTGILLCSQPGQPLLAGGTGSQSRLLEMPGELPDRHEAGTHNVPGIAGLHAGMEFVRKTGLQRILQHETALRRQCAAALQQVPGLEVFTGPDVCQTGVLSFRSSIDCEQMAQQLAQRSIAVRAGLHCAPAAHQSAGTLQSGTVRISFSAFNRSGQVEKLVWSIRQIMQEFA